MLDIITGTKPDPGAANSGSAIRIRPLINRFLGFFALTVAFFAMAGIAAAQTTVYNNVPSVLAPNYAALGYQATQTSEFGDYVHLAGSDRNLRTVTVTMSDWALESGNSAFCTANPGVCSAGVGYNHPITINIYGTVTGTPGTRHVGPNIATITQTKLIPWRPEADPSCTGVDAGKWKAADNLCYNGLAFDLTFDMSSLNVVLPNDVVVGVAFNTTNYGAAPTLVNGPYESLNVGAEGTATTGTDDNIDNVFWNTSHPAFYTDGGASGSGIFREDTHWGPGFGDNGTVMIKITAGPFCSPAPAGMVAWYKGENNANDSAGSNNGAVEGTVTYPAGQVGQSFGLAGAGDVRVPGSASLDVGQGSGISMATWVYPTNLGGGQQPYVEYDNGGSIGVHLWQSVNYGGAVGPADIYVNIVDTLGTNHVFYSNAGVLTQNAWNFVAFTYDKTSGDVSIYLNGVAIQVGANGAAPSGTVTNLVTGITPQTGPTYDVLLGHRPNNANEYFEGSLDEVQIFNTAISAGDVLATYNFGTNNNCLTTIVERPGNTDWANFNDTTNTFPALQDDYVAGPATPPLGSGSARLAGPDAAAKPAMVSQLYFGTRLADFLTLTYDTYVTSGTVPYLQFDVDYDSTTGSPAAFQGRAYFLPDAVNVTSGVWQHWDALGSQGHWFFSSNGPNPTNLCPTNGAGCTLAFVLTNYPNLAVSNGPTRFGLLFRTDPTGVTYVDKLTVGVDANSPTFPSTVRQYDFEQATSSTTVSCNPGPFVYTGSAISGGCTSTYTTSDGLSGSGTVSYSPDNINVGLVTVTGSYAGDANHQASVSSTPATFNITQAPVTVTAGSYNGVYDTFAHPTSACVVTGFAGLTCTNNPASVGPGVSSGSVTATLDGPNGNFAVTVVDGTYSITQATQTITFAQLPDKSFGDPDFGVSATGGASGNPVTFSSQTPGVCTVTGSTVHIVTTGSCTVRASQAGDTNYSAAPNVDNTFTISYCGVLSVPAISSPTNVDVDIPVNISDTTGAGVLSVQFTFHYDSTKMVPVLNPAGAIVPGTDQTVSYTAGTVTLPGVVVITASNHAPVGPATEGVITVEIHSGDASTFSGAGSLLKLKMHVTGPTGTLNSAITLPQADFLINGVQGFGGLCTQPPVDGSLSITQTATTTTVASDINPSTWGQAVTFTATVVANTPAGPISGPVPSSVDFKVDGVSVCAAAPVSLGMATCTTSSIPVAGSPHLVEAFYSGNSDFGSSNGTLLNGQVVNKANAVCTISGYGPTPYDALSHGATGSCVGVAGDLAAAGSSLSLGASFTDVPGGTANWSFMGGPNYNDQSGTASIQITKANAVCTISGYGPTPYDALSHGATGSCVGVAGDPSATGSSLSLGSAFTNVPGGTANWSFTGGMNYNDQSGTAAIQIGKANAVCTISGYGPTQYDAASHSATGNCVGVTGDLAAAGSSLNLGASFTNVPGGTANWSFTGGTNYNDQSGSVAIQITKADATFTVTPYDVTFDGLSHTAAVSTITGVGGETGATVGVVDVNNTTHTNVGTYAADYWFFTGTGNYNSIGNTTITDKINSGTIQGTVSYVLDPMNLKKVEGVLLSAVGSPNTSATTAANGTYTLSSFGTGAYTVTPSKTKQACNFPSGPFGVGASDASLVSQHVVHLITLTGTKLEAAKVSGAPTVTAFDASLIAQRSVHICDSMDPTANFNSFSHAGEWKFIPASRFYASVTLPLTGENYDAYMIGDIDGDWQTGNAPNRPASRSINTGKLTTNRTIETDVVRASLGNVETQPGTVVNVPVRMDNLNGAGITSYQFSVHYDPSVLEPSQLAADIAGTQSEGLSVVSNSPEPGLLMVAVYGAFPVTGDGVFVNLRFSAIGKSGSTSPLTVSEFIYNGKTDAGSVDGQVTVSADSQQVGLRGKLSTAAGEGLTNARVVLTSSNGQRFVSTSSSDGYFEFGGLTAGDTFTVTVDSKRYTFSSRMVNTRGNLTDLNMTADQ